MVTSFIQLHLLMDRSIHISIFQFFNVNSYYSCKPFMMMEPPILYSNKTILRFIIEINGEMVKRFGDAQWIFDNGMAGIFT